MSGRNGKDGRRRWSARDGSGGAGGRDDPYGGSVPATTSGRSAYGNRMQSPAGRDGSTHHQRNYVMLPCLP